MMKHIIFISLLLLASPLFSANKFAYLTQDSTRNTESFRFFGMDYNYTARQVPSSDNYNLTGLNRSFSSFQVDFNFPFSFGKSEKSTFISSFTYSNFVTNNSLDDNYQVRLREEAPVHLQSLPTISTLGASILYHYQISNKWQVNAGMDITHLSSKNEEYKNRNQNLTAFVLFQIQRNHWELGGGAIALLIRDINIFPTINLSYAKNKFSFQFTPPQSINLYFHPKEKVKYGFETKVFYSGFDVRYNAVGAEIPETVTNLGFDLSWIYDRKFTDALHYKLGIGYQYQEHTYYNGNVELDKLVYQDGLLVKISLYSTL